MTKKAIGLKQTKMVPGICNSCGLSCPILVHVHGEEVGYVQPNESAPNGAGLCANGIESIKLIKHPARLLHPMKKGRDGKFSAIEWSEAFFIIAEKLQRIMDKEGPEAIGFFWGKEANIDFPLQFFRQFCGTSNTYGISGHMHRDRSIAAMSILGHALLSRDYRQSHFTMLWGLDVFGSSGSPYEMSEMLTALGNRGRLVVVDPIRSRTAEKADVWIPLKAGTDGALAMAILHRIISTQSFSNEFCRKWVHGFDEMAERVVRGGYSAAWAESITGIAAETIVSLADEFSSAKSALMDGGRGLSNCFAGLDVFRTILMLNSITGNIDGPGNILLKDTAPLRMPITTFEDDVTLPQEELLSQAMKYSLSTKALHKMLYNGKVGGNNHPIKAAIFYGTNPARSLPEPMKFVKHIMGMELSVTIDIQMSETAKQCDIVLPETTSYERGEIRQGMWLGPQVLLNVPAIPPKGKSKPIYEIIRGIADAIGHGKHFAWNTWEDWGKHMTKELPISFDQLKQQGTWEGPLQYKKYVGRGFATPNGKINLSSDLNSNQKVTFPRFSKDTIEILPDTEYPFKVIQKKISYGCNSETPKRNHLSASEGDDWIEINPKDAVYYGITEDCIVQVESRLGSICLTVKRNENVQPGVLKIVHPHSVMLLNQRNELKMPGVQFNDLIDTHFDPVSESLCYNDFKVRIVKVFPFQH